MLEAVHSQGKPRPQSRHLLHATVGNMRGALRLWGAPFVGRGMGPEIRSIEGESQASSSPQVTERLLPP